MNLQCPLRESLVRKSLCVVPTLALANDNRKFLNVLLREPPALMIPFQHLSQTVPHQHWRHAEIRLETTQSFQKTSVRCHGVFLDVALREIRPRLDLRSQADVPEKDLEL